MPLKKNTSPSSEDTQLLAIFKAHFKGKLHLSRIRLICYFITALCKVKSVNYSKLSVGFDGKASTSSCYRRIQRFMAESNLCMEMVARLIFSLLPEKDHLTLVMDRTNWKFGQRNINVLMLGVSYRNVAFPLMFTMLDKRGNSNEGERIALVGRFMEWFGRERIDCLLADREFVGRDWIGFLNANGIRYHIRIRNNFKVYCFKNNREVTAFHWFYHLKPHQFYHYPKIVRMHGELCYLSGMKTISNGKLEYLIIVSYNRPREALEYYRERWQIETLFKALKSSGFNIEDTHVTQLDRVEKLFMLTMIAFIWCYKIGDFVDRKIKPISLKKHGRRAVSVFKYGLDWLSNWLLTGINKLNINLIHFLSCT